MSQPLWLWVTFNVFVLVMIVADLFVFNRHNKPIGMKKALLTSAMWIALALAFNYGIYVYEGKEVALNFLAGYLLEKALSVDNLFVFILIFKYFHTPAKLQHKVLFWGILGAIILRAVFIFFGIAIVSQFHWVLYLFGIFLIYNGIQMALPKSEEIHPDENPVLKLFKKWMPITTSYEDGEFFVKRLNRWWATPLFIVLLTVESTDVIFALDSIPAVMAITLDPFIIYSSNIFAILGLRSLYFALSGMMDLFHYLNYGLAAILIFVGAKMLLEPFIEVPIGVALGFIAVSLTVSMVASRL